MGNPYTKWMFLLFMSFISLVFAVTHADYVSIVFGPLFYYLALKKFDDWIFAKMWVAEQISKMSVDTHQTK